MSLEFSVAGGDLRRVRVALVEIKPVAQGDAPARRHRVVAGMRIRRVLVGMLAEGVGAEETVVARHPPGRIPGVPRIVEDRDAVDLAVVRRVIVAPVPALAPGRAVAVARAGEDMALAGQVL